MQDSREAVEVFEGLASKKTNPKGNQLYVVQFAWSKMDVGKCLAIKKLGRLVAEETPISKQPIQKNLVEEKKKRAYSPQEMISGKDKAYHEQLP